MFPDLLTYAPVVTAQFHLSLPQDLITSLRLLQAVDAFEGMSEWVYQTAAALPDDFQTELTLLGYPIKWCFRRQDSLIWRLPPEHPVHRQWAAFRDYLEEMPAAEFQRVLLLNLSQEAGRVVALAPSSAQASGKADHATVGEMLRRVRRSEEQKWGQAFVDLWDDAPLVALINTPRPLKDRLISLLTRFWESYYREDFERHRAALERSVAYHQQQTYPPGFTDLFRQVTGRALSPTAHEYVQQHLTKIERVIFSPCSHLGLYFQITQSSPTLVVAFNYRTTPTQETERRAAVELFPPLKALADETRLHILSLLKEREMYAQEIVEAVGLSQSTISRHLQLLERTEIVNARQARGMKFYSINRERGRTMLDALKYLIE
jgi:DNA-binding transcriptional ArsR family regulator